jgi:hypothetical protein
MTWHHTSPHLGCAAPHPASPSLPDPAPSWGCRHDAGLAGAELALEVERHTLATGSVDTVGTTGIFEVAPNAVNSVPREAHLAIGEPAGGCGRHGSWRRQLAAPQPA